MGIGGDEMKLKAILVVALSVVLFLVGYRDETNER